MTNARFSRRALELVLTTALVGIFSDAVSGEEVKPAAPPTRRTIGEILANPVRDEPVVVSGTVVRRIVENDYLLDDGTGTLVVDGGPIKHHSLDLPINSTVNITGEVGLGPRSRTEKRPPEVDIFSVTKADGT